MCDFLAQLWLFWKSESKCCHKPWYDSIIFRSARRWDEEATLLQLWIQKIKSMIKLTWFHPCSKVNITGRKLIERGTWDLRSSSWWKETFNMAFFQIHGQQWETLNKTSLLVNILYCIDNVWDCNSWMGGSETGVVGQRREDSGRPGTTCILISEVKAVLDFQLSDVCDNAK